MREIFAVLEQQKVSQDAIEMGKPSEEKYLKLLEPKGPKAIRSVPNRSTVDKIVTNTGGVTNAPDSKKK